VLAALNIGAVLVGVATGGLAASVLGLILGSALTLLGVDEGPGIGLVVGMLSGLAAGGWVSGKRARHSARFHGAVTGLVMAFLVLVIAVLGGSPASTVSVIWLAVMSMAIAGLSGWLAGRRAGPTG
jgi:putative membrane protein (TIGR04086 family)